MKEAVITLSNSEGVVQGEFPGEALAEVVSYRDGNLAELKRMADGIPPIAKRLERYFQIWKTAGAKGHWTFHHHGSEQQMARPVIPLSPEEYQAGLEIDALLNISRKRRMHMARSDQPFAWTTMGEEEFRETLRLAMWSDNKVSLYDVKSRRFPIGILDVIEAQLERIGLTCRVIDGRKKPKRTFNWALTPEWREKMQTRNFQLKGRLLARKNDLGFYDWATGSGKTLLFASIIIDRGCKTLILVPGEAIMFQIRDFLLQTTNIPPEYIGLFHSRERTLAPVTIAIINSANSRVANLMKYGFKMVIVDEAHHASARTYIETLKKIDPYYRYGFSGTPFRTKLTKRGQFGTSAGDMLLKATFGKIIQVITSRQLIDQGILSDLNVRYHDITDPDFLKDGVWSFTYQQGIVQHPVRNAKIAELTLEHLKQGRQIMIMVHEKAHGELLQGIVAHHVKTQGHSAFVAFNCSDTPENERRWVLQQFRNRDIDVLIATQVYAEGIDLPTLDVLIFAGGLKSEGYIFQRTGRGLRKGSVEHSGSVYQKLVGHLDDFIDTHHGHLLEHSLQRMESLEKAGFEVTALEEVRKDRDSRQRRLLERQQKEREEYEAYQRFREAKQDELKRLIEQGRNLVHDITSWTKSDLAWLHAVLEEHQASPILLGESVPALPLLSLPTLISHQRLPKRSFRGYVDDITITGTFLKDVSPVHGHKLVICEPFQHPQHSNEEALKRLAEWLADEGGFRRAEE